MSGIRASLLTGLLLVPSLIRSNPPGLGPDVLFLNSYHPGLFWSDRVQEGVREAVGPHQRMAVEYLDSKNYEGPAGEARLVDVVAKYTALSEEMAANGVLRGGDGLQPSATATTVKTLAGGGQSLHDGPFAETREHLGGYFILDVPDLDAALAYARRVPVAEGGMVEVRPIAIY